MLLIEQPAFPIFRHNNKEKFVKTFWFSMAHYKIKKKKYVLGETDTDTNADTDTDTDNSVCVSPVLTIQTNKQTNQKY